MAYIEGTEASEPIVGTDQSDLIIGFDGADTIEGGLGNDTIQGNDGQDSGDVIDGGDGRDAFEYYGVEDVAIDLASGTTSSGATLASIEDAWGGDGNDSILGSADANLLRGWYGSDTLDGGDGADLVDGEAGSDSIVGGVGDDTLVGGFDADTLNGGTGTDVAEFTGDMSEYDVTQGQDVNGYFTRVEHRGGGADGVDLLYNVESLKFADQTTPICFMPGTLVATPTGSAAVETLRRGDLVLTADGAAAPVVWMGRQTVSRRFSDPLRALPIRIAAGALGEELPRRDLLVSADHALFLDGILVHAGALVNGSTVRRETNVPESWTYWHVELANHALVLAEGVAAETFIDNVDRMAFDNWAEHQALHPDDQPIAEMSFPRAKSHRQVPERLRQRLAARARSATSAAA